MNATVSKPMQENPLIEPETSVRLAHFSDLHFTQKKPGWRASDLFSKRVPAWINMRLFGRGYRFRHATKVLEALAAELPLRNLNHLVFSGDATALGFEAEVQGAARLLRVGETGLGGLAVPGNHDYFTNKSISSGAFERFFGPWQVGKRLDNQVYPFAQKVGHLWLIGVNSCTSNRWPWDASGEVGPDQLERLKQLLAQLGPGLRILVTHYPVLRANRRREPRIRALRDLDRMLEVAANGNIRLWLHGHRHDRFHHRPEEGSVPFPVVCAGSATQSGRWSYVEYTLTGTLLHGLRRVFDRTLGQFVDKEMFDINLSESKTPSLGEFVG